MTTSEKIARIRLLLDMVGRTEDDPVYHLEEAIALLTDLIEPLVNPANGTGP